MSGKDHGLVTEQSAELVKAEAEITFKTTPITIGDMKYDVELSQIPYLSSFVGFQTKAQPQATAFVHGPIPLFGAALRGVQSGYRQCFRTLPPELPQYHVLCETYDFLGINVLGEQRINDIFIDIKAGKTEWEHGDRYYKAVKGNKSKARDAAFKLLYLMLLGEFEDENKDSVKAYNAVLFVVSHPGTFNWRTRTVVRAAYEERFVVSPKQIARLDQWMKGDTADDIEDDVTTEEESPDEYYGSDWS